MSFFVRLALWRLPLAVLFDLFSANLEFDFFDKYANGAQRRTQRHILKLLSWDDVTVSHPILEVQSAVSPL